MKDKEIIQQAIHYIQNEIDVFEAKRNNSIEYKYVLKEDVDKILEILNGKFEIYLNMKTGKIKSFLSDKKIIVKKLSINERRVLALLSNNYIISKKDITEYIYKHENVKFTGGSIEETIARLRRKGFRIENKIGAGYIMRDNIYIDY